jgi:hypothetical protein
MHRNQSRICPSVLLIQCLHSMNLPGIESRQSCHRHIFCQMDILNSLRTIIIAWFSVNPGIFWTRVNTLCYVHFGYCSSNFKLRFGTFWLFQAFSRCFREFNIIYEICIRVLLEMLWRTLGEALSILIGKKGVFFKVVRTLSHALNIVLAWSNIKRKISILAILRAEFVFSFRIIECATGNTANLVFLADICRTHFHAECMIECVILYPKPFARLALKNFQLHFVFLWINVAICVLHKLFWTALAITQKLFRLFGNERCEWCILWTFSDAFVFIHKC